MLKIWVPPVVAFVVVASLVGCGDDDATTTTEALPTTTEAMPDSNGPVIEVSFDGSSCSADGPSTIAPGEHSFVLTDTSDRTRSEMYVKRLTDGHTYQELVDLQAEVGGPGTPYPKPDFQEGVALIAPVSFPTENQSQSEHVVETGQHSFVVIVGGDAADEVWNCGSFEVAES